MEQNPHLTERERQELAELERIFAGAGEPKRKSKEKSEVPERHDPKH